VGLKTVELTSHLLKVAQIAMLLLQVTLVVCEVALIVAKLSAFLLGSLGIASASSPLSIAALGADLLARLHDLRLGLPDLGSRLGQFLGQPTVDADIEPPLGSPISACSSPMPVLHECAQLCQVDSVVLEFTTALCNVLSLLTALRSGVGIRNSGSRKSGEAGTDESDLAY
jgi:hypothetical protein